MASGRVPKKIATLLIIQPFRVWSDPVYIIEGHAKAAVLMALSVINGMMIPDYPPQTTPTDGFIPDITLDRMALAKSRR